MANRAEMSGGQEEFFTHQQRMESRVKRLFTSYSEQIVRARANWPLVAKDTSSETYLYRKQNDILEFGITSTESNKGFSHERNLLIRYRSQQPEVTLRQFKTEHTPITIEYTDQRGENDFYLPDATIIKVPGDPDKTIYTFSNKSLDCRSSVDLSIKEMDDALAVHDDPYTSGLIFPLHINLDKEFGEFEALLKRK